MSGDSTPSNFRTLQPEHERIVADVDDYQNEHKSADSQDDARLRRALAAQVIGPSFDLAVVLAAKVMPTFVEMLEQTWPGLC